MGDIIGMGLSHYPGPAVPVEAWPDMLTQWVKMGRIDPADFAAQDKWPAAMRAEWGGDAGQSSARLHRDRLFAGYARLRKALDDFQPDVVVMFGDDQYENFKQDCIPAFAVGIFDSVACKPFGTGRVPFGTDVNIWNVPADTELTVQCSHEAAAGLCRDLLAQDFDVAYSRAIRHPKGLSHSFALAVLYLDLERKGFPYPIVPLSVNCYGNQLIKTAAGAHGEGADEISPPAPTPKRCFAFGRAVARYYAASPWRVAIIGSSSWSHASLTAKHGRLYPDIPADRVLHEDLKNNRFDRWGGLDLGALEDAGQHELLNWVCLAGAMTELGQKPQFVDYVETYVFNSNKCFAVFPPADGRGSVPAV